jgi:GNAT superfamily N-acetyltransferase
MKMRDIIAVMRSIMEAGLPRVDAFIDEYENETWPNPLNPRERVHGGGNAFAVIELSKDRFAQDSIHVSAIRSAEVGKGYGREALKFLCDLADKHGVALTGIAKAFGSVGLDTKDLLAWYRRYGFKPVAGGSAKSGYTIKRPPKTAGSSVGGSTAPDNSEAATEREPGALRIKLTSRTPRDWD